MTSIVEQSRAPDGWTARAVRVLQSRGVLGVGYGLATLLTGVAIILTVSPPATGPIGPASQAIFTLLGINLVLILALMAIVALRLRALVAVRASDAGARLHLRFVTLFSLAAAAPAIVVALFMGVLVNRGVENWFSQRTRTVIDNSAIALRSYVEDQYRYIGDHVPAMGAELNRAAETLQRSPVSFSQYLGALASFHAFSAAYVIDGEGRILARAEVSDAPDYIVPPAASFKGADADPTPSAGIYDADVVRSLYKLSAYSPATYLYVVRSTQKGMVSSLREAESAVVSWREAAQNRGRIQTIFSLSYAETFLLVLVGAAWLGISAANAISAPIGRLVQAAGRVSSGDLTARVDAESDPDEIAVLSRAFNRMTHDLQAQQEALRRAQEEAESGRQFIETVLAEVSAGVVGLDRDGRVTAANRQAEVLLALPGGEVRGARLAEVAPEFEPVLEALSAGGAPEAEIDLVRGRETRRLSIRASRSEDGVVLTFDDITRLVTAQRNAAWRDVARRIAHEIKNPLTPIQLSAERLRKKYRKDIPEADVEIFDRCTDTIVRQVGDIGRMVDEFSAFARMPAPKFAEQDVAELLRAGVFAQGVASADIEVVLEDPVPEVTLLADGRMLSQALTNVLKNAAEAVTARLASGQGPGGRIIARLVSDDSGVTIEIEDNGVGLPAKDRERLTEPYVTTREKGTGLGLAIVKRIMEDHGGELTLADARSGHGALALMRLPPSARIRGKSISETLPA
jgi:two-component system nitrogen regulation sensor histidine kinase NtrY